MGELLLFPFDAYQHHVRKTARWLAGRKSHLVEKNLRAEANRFHAGLQNRGLTFEQAHERSAIFASDVVDRFNEIMKATREGRACRVIHIITTHGDRKTA